jgi:hypothetical protein
LDLRGRKWQEAGEDCIIIIIIIIIITTTTTIIIIITDLKEIWCEVMDWMHLSQDRDKWQAVVNTVMNLRVP